MSGDDDPQGGFRPVAAARKAAQEAETQLSQTGDSIPPSTLGVGSVLAGKYRLTRFLGQGGMGSVWVGEQVQLGVPVAVKVMHAWVAAQPQYVERFRREARAALMLSHPNVVRVIDFGQHEATFFLVMEMIEGKALDEWLAECPGMPALADVVAISVDVLDALDAAHRHGIVHRDLKPENVILSRDSQGRRVAKVVDFGLAHVDDPDTHAPTLTKKDMIAGTPAYMSPEQSRSLQVGPSTDLYAFGCLLTDLLQKQPPFEAPNAIETISQHLFMPPPPLARPEGSEPVPPLLEALRLELLAKHPHQRPPDAKSAKARLLEAVDREASAARLPPRKGELPGGDRAHRVPGWNSGAVPEDAPAVHGSVAIVPRAGSLLADPALLAGLAAHGLAASHSRQVDVGADVVVYDAGSSVAAAVQALGSNPAARVIAVLDHVDAAAMRQLIEAGAADVMAAPVTADVLARKVKRLLRRR
ncbi:MAG: serine/threonine protein kinase [Polyangiaceae bacterium]|nr:serine/threonine protein kinase [Polyangiaceae bacterium]